MRIILNKIKKQMFVNQKTYKWILWFPGDDNPAAAQDYSSDYLNSSTSLFNNRSVSKFQTPFTTYLYNSNILTMGKPSLWHENILLAGYVHVLWSNVVEHG